MKIIMLKKNPNLYSCNSYFILGEWNRIEDVNTLIDIGQDGYIIDQIEGISTGLGKKPVDLVVFTHNHFDHTAGLKYIKEKYNPLVYAFNKFDGVDFNIIDGQVLKMGDGYFEVIHIPGHSNDSVLLYCRKQGIIFTGDTSLNIRSTDATYADDFISVIEKLIKLKIDVIYSGHDEPVLQGADKVIMQTYCNINKNSDIIKKNNHADFSIHKNSF